MEISERCSVARSQEEDEEPRNGSLAPPRYNADPRDDLHPYRSTRRGIGDPSHGRFRSTSFSRSPRSPPHGGFPSLARNDFIVGRAHCRTLGASLRSVRKNSPPDRRIPNVFPAPFRITVGETEIDGGRKPWKKKRGYCQGNYQIRLEEIGRSLFPEFRR